MKVKLVNPLPETLKLRHLLVGDELEVEFISTDLEAHDSHRRTKGYRVSDRNGKPITLYAEEVILLNG